MEQKEFMSENVVKIENIKYVASSSFIDENGQPLEWELRCLSRVEDEEIIKSCVSKGINGLGTDPRKYIAMVMISSIVSPNLNDIDLQTSYGVNTAEELLKKILNQQEYYKLMDRIRLLNFGK